MVDSGSVRCRFGWEMLERHGGWIDVLRAPAGAFDVVVGVVGDK